MSLNERLNEDMKQTMKSQDKFTLSVIRMVRSAIKNAEIDLRRPLDEQEIIDILQREVKQRKDSLREFEKAGRHDLAETVSAELGVIGKYLPEQLSEEEITLIVQQTIREAGAASKADTGKVMGLLMPKVKGKADGRLVNQIVQQLLN